MTADSTTCLKSSALEPSVLASRSWARPDPVRSRVAYQQPLTNSERLHAEAARPPKPAETVQDRRPASLLPDTGGSRPRRPHPGDILYWVACLGGVCLLLLSATT
jgi:hypothetical protein